MAKRSTGVNGRLDDAVNIHNLAFSYGGGEILKLKDLRIARGEKILIYGESGCGKSTLLNLIAGILPGYAGSLSVLGQNMAELTPARRDRFRSQNIAVIFQQFNLIPYLSVRENVLLAAKLAHRAVDENYLQTVLEHLQISALAGQRADSLSQGQGQRVAAARALVNDSAIILADEPTSALDDMNSRLFLDLVFREARAKATTLIVVSHDLRYKKRFDRTIDLVQINHGRRFGSHASADRSASVHNGRRKLVST